MAYVTYGYGTWLDELDEKRFRWRNLIEEASKLDAFENSLAQFEELTKAMASNPGYAFDPNDPDDVEKAAKEWVESYENDECHAGLAALIADVASVDSGMTIESYDESKDGAVYVGERMPWDLNEKERAASKADWQEAIAKWIRVLTDEPARFITLELHWS